MVAGAGLSGVRKKSLKKEAKVEEENTVKERRPGALRPS